MKSDSFKFESDNAQIFVRHWSANASEMLTPSRAVMLIAHGAAEHSERYQRIAQALVAEGVEVYAPDHRGHGKTVGALTTAGDAGEDGFNRIIGDLKQLIALLKSRHAGKPLFLMGHSMGAALVQRLIQLEDFNLNGVVLSGSPGLRPNLEQAAAGTAKVAEGAAAQQPSQFFKQMFAKYNEGFAPIVTGFEWLSRDVDEVKKYADDPWCGFPFSNRLVAQMSACALESAKVENIARIPKSLPIYFFAGSHDRVGGDGAYVEALAQLYRANGIRDVEVKLYQEGRHEMLNETNRDEVQRDLVAWLRKHL